MQIPMTRPNRNRMFTWDLRVERLHAGGHEIFPHTPLPIIKKTCFAYWSNERENHGKARVRKLLL